MLTALNDLRKVALHIVPPHRVSLKKRANTLERRVPTRVKMYLVDDSSQIGPGRVVISLEVSNVGSSKRGMLRNILKTAVEK